MIGFRTPEAAADIPRTEARKRYIPSRNREEDTKCIRGAGLFAQHRGNQSVSWLCCCCCQWFLTIDPISVFVDQKQAIEQVRGSGLLDEDGQGDNRQPREGRDARAADLPLPPQRACKSLFSNFTVSIIIFLLTHGSFLDNGRALGERGDRVRGDQHNRVPDSRHEPAPGQAVPGGLAEPAPVRVPRSRAWLHIGELKKNNE